MPLLLNVVVLTTELAEMASRVFAAASDDATTPSCAWLWLEPPHKRLAPWSRVKDNAIGFHGLHPCKLLKVVVGPSKCK
jgi:hypothetical protein